MPARAGASRLSKTRLAGGDTFNAMSRVARYGKMAARGGEGPKLAEVLLAAAAELGSEPGCELYLVNHQAGSPDILWVTELWRSQADLDATISRIRGSAQVAAAMPLVQHAEMIELELLGGKGPGAAGGPA